MKDILYYIRGSKENPEGVRKALLEVCPTAKNPSQLSFKNECCLYYLIDNIICCNDCSHSVTEVIKRFGTELQPKKVVKFVEKTMYKCICAGAIRDFYTTQLYSTIDEVMSQSNAIGYEEVKVMVKE